METINDFDQLIAELNRSKGHEDSYLSTLKRVDIPKETYNSFLAFNEDNYVRNCIYKNNDYELVLVCFEKGQGSPVHDYDAHSAWITVLEGKLREEKYVKPIRGGSLETVSSVNLSLGDFSFIHGAVGIHRYYNIFGSRTVCLCLFSKPVSTWNVYDVSNGTSEIMETWYNKQPDDFNILLK